VITAYLLCYQEIFNIKQIVMIDYGVFLTHKTNISIKNNGLQKKTVKLPSFFSILVSM